MPRSQTRRIRHPRSFALAAVLLTVAAVGLQSLAGAAEEVHWDYYSHGGADGWGELRAPGSDEPAYPACNLDAQSPVDVPAGLAPRDDGLSVDYRPTRLAVLNNGHTVQINYERGSSLTVDGTRYDLLQFHFHTPSEHRIGGRAAALEGHFVHRSADRGLAVLAVLIVEGGANDAFQAFLDAMPAAEGVRSTALQIDASYLLPAERSFYAYDGSLTTPPCSEGVRWYLLSQPLEVSPAQVEQFRSLPFLHHDGEFVGNARPVQPLNGRLAAPAQPEGPPAVTPPSTGSGGLVN